uniref:hypothetical protein n=1 Tax=Mycobacterium tuberculosis TaxID=1773 RepID=UPI00254C9D8D
PPPPAGDVRTSGHRAIQFRVWSSVVCSSYVCAGGGGGIGGFAVNGGNGVNRSEERRVGTEGDWGG